MYNVKIKTFFILNVFALNSCNLPVLTRLGIPKKSIQEKFNLKNLVFSLVIIKSSIIAVIIILRFLKIPNVKLLAKTDQKTIVDELVPPVVKENETLSEILPQVSADTSSKIPLETVSKIPLEKLYLPNLGLLDLQTLFSLFLLSNIYQQSAEKSFQKRPLSFNQFILEIIDVSDKITFSTFSKNLPGIVLKNKSDYKLQIIILPQLLRQMTEVRQQLRLNYLKEMITPHVEKKLSEEAYFLIYYYDKSISLCNSEPNSTKIPFVTKLSKKAYFLSETIPVRNNEYDNKRIPFLIKKWLVKDQVLFLVWEIKFFQYTKTNINDLKYMDWLPWSYLKFKSLLKVRPTELSIIVLRLFEFTPVFCRENKVVIANLGDRIIQDFEKNFFCS